MVGADICGFIDPTTEELCGRWTAMGAFYTFTRNHHEPQENQEPYLWPSVEAVAKKVLGMRYALLPTLYTMFWRVHTSGGTVARSLMFNYPQDLTTYSIDHQFMWGSVLLITPVLSQGAVSVAGYWPPASVWYDLWSLHPLGATGQMTLPCSIADAILLHIAGGNIIVTQTPALTTTASRDNPFALIIAMSAAGSAAGEFFWDSGADLVDGSNNLILSFAANQQTGLTTTLVQSTFKGIMPSMESIRIAGFSLTPSAISVNGQTISSSAWNFDSANQLLTITPISVPLDGNLKVTWVVQKPLQPLVALD